MMIALQIAMAILPGLLIIWFIYREDLYEKENWLPLVLSFMLGVAVTYPVMKMQELFYDMGWKDDGSLWNTLFSAFILVAFTEELVKYVALLLYPYRSRFFNEPLDGIVYATFIGMGFATLENVLYAYRYDMATTLVRALTAVPAHATFAALMGYYIGKAKFDLPRRRSHLIKGLIMAITLHGLYDFFVLQNIDDGLMILSIVILTASILYTLELIRELQQESPFREKP